MKKFLSMTLALILCLTMLTSLTVFAAPTGSATLTGPGTVRAGDTITLTFNLNGKGLYGASGVLSYDKNVLTLSGNPKQKIASPWMVEFNGNSFVAYDNALTSPINSNKALFAVTFKVKENVAVGTEIKVSYTDVKATDGSADANIGTVTYSVKVAAPKSTNCELGSLSVKDVTLSPTFSAGTTSYTANVPFSVSKLDIKATAADSKAKVSISGNSLKAGGTTNVTVTVTAESGATKTYTIKVTRAQDPNYVASGENALSGIKVDGFLLSPVFKADVTKYVVWLPYETESIKVSGTAKDGKASVEVVGGDNLEAGKDNEIKIVCTAENGTTKEYIIIAKRAAAHGSEPDTDTPGTDTPGTDTPGTDTPGTDTPGTDDPSTDKPGDDKLVEDQLSGGMPWWVAVITLVVGLAGGWVICTLMKKQRVAPYIPSKK